MKKFFVSLAIIAAVFVPATSALAVSVNSSVLATVTPQEQACTGAGGTWNAGTKECDAPGNVKLIGKGSLVTAVTNTLLVVIGAASVIMMIIGGLRYVLSNGDQNAVTAAKNTILYSAIGLIVAMLAYAITSFIVTAIG